MTKCRRLCDLIPARAALPVPGVYDAFSALLVQPAGFLACQVSGFAVAAAALGLPDIGILSMRDQIAAVGCIATAVDIPVMADGDTGFGNALNTFHTVRLMEAAGARANACLGAGATLVFVEAPATREDIAAIVRAVPARGERSVDLSAQAGLAPASPREDQRLGPQRRQVDHAAAGQSIA